jgi:hypothetical protein
MCPYHRVSVLKVIAEAYEKRTAAVKVRVRSFETGAHLGVAQKEPGLIDSVRKTSEHTAATVGFGAIYGRN